MIFCRLQIIFLTLLFSKYSFRNIIRVSNSLDPVQAQYSVGPDLHPNCLQRLSADDKISRWQGKCLGLVVQYASSVSFETRLWKHKN